MALTLLLNDNVKMSFDASISMICHLKTTLSLLSLLLHAWLCPRQKLESFSIRLHINQLTFNHICYSKLVCIATAQQSQEVFTDNSIILYVRFWRVHWKCRPSRLRMWLSCQNLFKWHQYLWQTRKKNHCLFFVY